MSTVLASLAVTLVYLSSIFLSGRILGTVFALTIIPWNKQPSEPFEIVREIVFAILVLLITWGFTRLEQNAKVELGFNSSRPLFEIATGFLVGAFNVAVVISFLYWAGNYRASGFNQNAQIWAPLVCYFFGALIEELVFRGYIFQRLEHLLGTSRALLGASLIFGLCHMINPVPGASAGEKLYGCLCLFLEAGILLNAAYLLYRNLWFAIGLHWAWNFCEGTIFGAPVSGTTMGVPLLQAKLAGPFVATGGTFGPEASLAGVLTGLTLGLTTLAVAYSRGNWRPAPSLSSGSAPTGSVSKRERRTR